jgi:hypothetical protein
MLHNLSQLLSEFDKFVATYFFELAKVNYKEHNLFFQEKEKQLSISWNQV